MENRTEEIIMFVGFGVCHRCNVYTMGMVAKSLFDDKVWNLCLMCIEEIYGNSKAIPENLCDN